MQKKNTIGLFTAINIVVANMIGTGIFTSLGFQVTDIKSGFALLFLWVVGGIAALCGALSYGELGAVMPRSGGEFHFLSRIYHPAVGFLSGWVSATAGFAAPIAAAAVALGNYSAKVFPALAPTLVALVVAVGISLIHMQNIKFGSYFQNLLTPLKVLLIFSFVICGLFLGKPQDISFLPAARDLNLIFSSSFAVSLVYVMYSYSGWNASVYIASEVKAPEKNVPWSLFLGTLIVLLSYLLLNFIFLYTTPIQAMVDKVEVGYIVANQIFGTAGGKIMGSLISLGLLSTISSMIWAGPRVMQVMGEDIPFFQLLAAKNRHGVPHYATLFQLVIVLALILTSSFAAIVTYLGFTLTLSSSVTVLGVFIHRFRYPEVSRPYRVGILPPLIFLAISIWMLIFIYLDKPVESLAGLGTILLGLPVYLFAVKRQVLS
ncbi:MAG: amino acid permease [Chroococcidiopsidaceae cyanobacterium CP_BM_ER_R8_30]|nr:amino acid permease [Chroococcidiopsidaceae cyanobacterium CP_BM_ER_R8_30]